jgi:speckle-type POZ protein
VTSETGNLKMNVTIEWNLANTEKEPKTYASKMISFRGEKVFRVGLKNLVQSPFLFFMTVELNKIGMKVKEVMWGQIKHKHELSPATMRPMTKEEIGDEGSLHLFKSHLQKQIIGNITFWFRIHIEGSVPEFSFRLSDRLAKHQLWDAVKSKNWIDVEFVVKGKTFSAHKAILAARSPVFAAEFTKEQTVGDAASHQMEPNLKKRKRNNGPHQIPIDGVEPTTFKQFLYFIYTGESFSSLANEELLKLADDYQLTTLADLCRTALSKIETSQMLNLMNNLHTITEIPNSSTVRYNILLPLGV